MRVSSTTNSSTTPGGPIPHVWTFEATNGYSVDGTVVTAGAGPFTQSLPATLSGAPRIWVQGAGAGAGAGGNDATNASGAGGGASGGCLLAALLAWKAGDSFTVTLGAGGSGGIKGGAGANNGGITTVSNGTSASRDPQFPAGVKVNGGNTTSTGTGGVSQAGSTGGSCQVMTGYTLSAGGTAGSAAGGAGGNSTVVVNNWYVACGGNGGGGSGAATAGAGGPPSINQVMPTAGNTPGATPTATGNLAGGGYGGTAYFGIGGAGGNGGAAGAAPTSGYGGGGGGGGGSANGGAGGGSYVRIELTY